MKKLFVALYGDQLKKPHTSTIECHFDDYFESRVRELEKKAGGPARVPTPSIVDSSIGKGDGWTEAPPIPGMMRGVPTNALYQRRNVRAYTLSIRSSIETRFASTSCRSYCTLFPPQTGLPRGSICEGKAKSTRQKRRKKYVVWGFKWRGKYSS